MEFEKDENFEIELFDPEGGATIGKVNRTAVTITNDDGKSLPLSIERKLMTLAIELLENNNRVEFKYSSFEIGIRKVSYIFKCCNTLEVKILRHNFPLIGKS